MLRGCRVCRVCRATSHLACHALTRLVGRLSAAVYYSAARLSVCCVVLQIPRARHARHITDRSLRPRSILDRHVRHAGFPRDMLATSS